MAAYPALRLDDCGRCPNCLRKPMPYKRDGHWFCMKCCRAYRMPGGEQINNWAWHPCGDGFIPHYIPNAQNRSGEYALAKPSRAALRRAGSRGEATNA